MRYVQCNGCFYLLMYINNSLRILVTVRYHDICHVTCSVLSPKSEFRPPRKIAGHGKVSLRSLSRADGKIAYSPIRSIFSTALRDPTIAKFISTNKVPVRRADSSITRIENAPVYSSHEFTTITLSYRWAALHGTEPILIGDSVTFERDGVPCIGFIRRLYTLEESPTDVRASVQIATQPSTLRLEGTYTEYDHILTDTEITVDMNTISLQKCVFDATAEPSPDCVRVAWRFHHKTKCLEEFKGYPRFDLPLRREERENLVVLFAELAKDELMVYRTKRFKDDVTNISIKDIPPEVQSRFNSIWSCAAFSQFVSTEQRHQVLAKMVREGERGFWAFNAAVNRWQYVLVCFGLYSADQAEFVEALCSLHHVGTSKSQCHRCSCPKDRLDDIDYERDETAMTHARRRELYEKASTMTKTDRKLFLRSNGLLDSKLCQFTFCKSLKLPENGMADSLHNWGLNIPCWSLSLLWICLNETGQRVLTDLLEKFKTEHGSSFVASMFAHVPKLLTTYNPKELKERRRALSNVRKSIRLQGDDWEKVMLLLDRIMNVLNQPIYHSNTLAEMFAATPVEIWENLDKVIPEEKIERSPRSMLGLYIKYFIQLYFLIKEHASGEKWNALRSRHFRILFLLMRNLFPGMLCNQSFHDSLHMFDQSIDLISTHLANTVKYEALNREHRFAAGGGNHTFSEFFILLRQFFCGLVSSQPGGYCLKNSSCLSFSEGIEKQQNNFPNQESRLILGFENNFF